MANPYALDFNPLASAITDNQQLDLARNRLAMDQERLGMEKTRLGFESELQPIRVQGAKLGNQQAEQAIKSGRLEYENAVGKTFSGVAQNISERLAKNPNDAGAIADWNAWANHPQYRDYFASKGIPTNDPLRGSQAVLMHVRGFQDPVAAEAKQAEIAKDRAQARLYDSQAESGNYLPLPENSRGVLNKRTGAVLGADTGDNSQREFDKGYAKEQAPKLYTEASARYKTAADTHQTLGAIAELAPFAATGFQGPLPPEIALKARKIAASFGLPGADVIAPTELFHFLTQKGVFDIVSKMKPATDLDMIAAREASLSVKTDPSTFALAVPVLKRIQERTMMIEQLEMRELRRGRPADPEAIMREVNGRLPLINMQGQAGQVDGRAAGPQVNKPVTDRLPQPGQPPAVTPAQEQLLNVPDGTRLGQYVIRGGKAYLEPAGAGPAQAPLVAPNTLPPGVAPELPAGYPAQRVQMRRAQEQAQAEAQRTQQRAQISSQFEADMRTLPPVEVARKYDSMRSMLDQRQLLQLNEIISRMTRR